MIFHGYVSHNQMVVVLAVESPHAQTLADSSRRREEAQKEAERARKGRVLVDVEKGRNINGCGSKWKT